MEFRNLGRSGLVISEIAYGNWITHGSQVEEDQATACVRAALDLGITTFDTADVYAGTRAEAVLGRALAGQRREGLEILTKVYWPTGPGRNDRGLSRKHILESINGSLRRLQTDYVDVYQAHRFDHFTALEETIDHVAASGKRAKILYTIANFHNPAAATMSLEKRKTVVELCRAHDILIVQDDAYGRISFGVDAGPSLFSVAGGTGSVLLGTFSKTLATGLRIGWVMGEQPLVDAITRMRFDMGVSPWSSRVISEFCETGKFAAHVERVRHIYRRKRDAMLAALDERCTRFARWSAPEGGFFLWLELSEGIDPHRLYETANDEAVAYVGGKPFFDDDSGLNYARHCYSNVAESDIPVAIMRFGRALERAAK